MAAISVVWRRRRYAKGERRCSDAVAARLHWLALVIEQLEGSYNTHGIRRWFQWPRAALDGRSPLDRLQGSWDPDDGSIQPILVLARSASLGMVAGQASGRWNCSGDQPVHVLASTPTVAWAEWIRHQEITDPGDLAGVAAALWAVLIPQEWGTRELVIRHTRAVQDWLAEGRQEGRQRGHHRPDPGPTHR